MDGLPSDHKSSPYLRDPSNTYEFCSTYHTQAIHVAVSTTKPASCRSDWRTCARCASWPHGNSWGSRSSSSKQQPASSQQQAASSQQQQPAARSSRTIEQAVVAVNSSAASSSLESSSLSSCYRRGVLSAPTL